MQITKINAQTDAINNSRQARSQSVNNQESGVSKPAFGMRLTLDTGSMMDVFQHLAKGEELLEACEETMCAVHGLNKSFAAQVEERLVEAFNWQKGFHRFFGDAYEEVIGEPFIDRKMFESEIVRKMMPNFENIELPIKFEYQTLTKEGFRTTSEPTDKIAVVADNIRFQPCLIGAPSDMPWHIRNGGKNIVEKLIIRSKLAEIEKQYPHVAKRLEDVTLKQKLFEVQQRGIIS